MAEPEKIIAACHKARQVLANVNDCHKFVEAVSADFAVTLTGTGDDIMAQIAGPGWTRHGMDGPSAAAAAAEEGELVIAGMTAAGLGDAHGHVVVVVDGELAHGKYPTAFWGSLNPSIRAAGGLGTTLNFAFSQTDRDRVVYASRPV